MNMPELKFSSIPLFEMPHIVTVISLAMALLAHVASLFAIKNFAKADVTNLLIILTVNVKSLSPSKISKTFSCES